MRRFMKAARIILLLMLVVLSGCKDLRTKRTLVEFSSAPVPFPETVLKIQGTSVSSVAFPKDTMRMVYFTPPASCFTCSVLHSYELCNLFDQQEGYMTILLMAPKPEDLTELIASIEDSNYDFPIYVTGSRLRQFLKTSASTLSLSIRRGILSSSGIRCAARLPERNSSRFWSSRRKNNL